MLVSDPRIQYVYIYTYTYNTIIYVYSICLTVPTHPIFAVWAYSSPSSNHHRCFCWIVKGSADPPR